MKKIIQQVLVVIFLAGCGSPNNLPCPVAEYETTNENNPVNTWCKEILNDESKLYAVGEVTRDSSRGMEIGLRMSEATAKANLAKKIAMFESKVRAMVTVEVSPDSTGEVSTNSAYSSNFNVKVDKVEVTVQKCIEVDTNLSCYTVVEMPKDLAIASIRENLKNDAELYETLATSAELEKTLADIR